MLVLYKTLCLLVTIILLAVSNVVSANEERPIDAFGVTDIKHLKEDDLSALPATISFEQLKERFGSFTRADSYAIGWPKLKQKKLNPIGKWKRSYWFFYKMDDKGRPAFPVMLDFVASIPENEKDISEAWLELVSKMKLDWPPEHIGNSVLEYYCAMSSKIMSDCD